MKKLIIAGVSLWALMASAGPRSEAMKSTLEAQTRCGRVVRFDESNLYLGFGVYRKGYEEPRQPIPGSFRVAPLNGSAARDFETRDGVVDIVVEGDRAFVLTYSEIEEWSLSQGQRLAVYDTYFKTGVKEYQEHATGMARYQDTLIISHGRLGVSFFNIKTKRLMNQYRLLQRQLPFESMATGVTVSGDKAYVLMDNFHLTRPEDGIVIFRGLIVVDMKSQAVVAEMAGMDAGADAIASEGSTLFVSFWGLPLWKYKMATLSGNTLPEPAYRLFSFPVKGHPTGSPAMDDKYYYTCFLKAPTKPGENGGRYTVVPMALNRQQLMMD